MAQWIGIEIDGAEPPSDFFLESYGLVPVDEMSDLELTKRGVNEWIRVTSLEGPFDRQSILRAIFGTTSRRQ